jgi:ribose transport system substrate-binding protein
MTAFERRQRLLYLLSEQPGITIPELARALSASRGTIRNDLAALENDGQVTRVRGGAVVQERHTFLSPAFATRAQTNREAKQRMARRAAEFVEDGDSILLDDSTTAFHIAPYLSDCHNLTIITNGVEVALALARNPDNTVILLGGALRAEDISVTGQLSERNLEELHVKTAFMSCSGLSIEGGLTETDLQEAQLKRKMISAADRVVVLAESGKLGRKDLAAFATLNQVSHLLTDSEVPPRFIEQIRHSCTVLTICGEKAVSSFVPCAEGARHYRIGFANLTEDRIPFALDVRRGLERAAEAAGNVDLIVADNRLNGEVALRVADYLISEHVDLAIEYQIDEKAGSLIMDKFRQAGMPVIAVDIPMVGATFFGVDNYRSGQMAGLGLGKWITAHWDGQVDRLIVLEELRAGALPAARIQGQLDGLQEILGRIEVGKIIRLDSGNTSEASEVQMLNTLRSHPNEHKLAVVCFNDDAAIGALSAARGAGREEDLVIVGQGADRRVCAEMEQPNSRIVGSTAFWPQHYGTRLIALATQILRGEPVPLAAYMDHVFVTAENLREHYQV